LQKWFVLALQGSLVIGLTALVGQSILIKVNFSNHRRRLLAAVVLAVFLALATFSFWLTTLAAKQTFSAQASIAVTGASLILLLLLWLPAEKWSLATSHFLGWLTLLAVAVLTYVFSLDIMPYFQNVFASNTAFITTAMVVRLSLGFIVILLSLALTAALSLAYFSTNLSQTQLNLLKADSLESSKKAKIAAPLLAFKLTGSFGLIAVCLAAATTALQMLLVLGKLPATPFIFNFVAVLVNQADKWFYLIFASLALAALMALFSRKPTVKAENKAQARKVKAAQRRPRRLPALM
jgi:hypothetical protein